MADPGGGTASASPGGRAPDAGGAPDRAASGGATGGAPHVGHGRSVVITGAGGGLGSAMATAAASAGWTVGVLDRDGAAAQVVTDAIVASVDREATAGAGATAATAGSTPATAGSTPGAGASAAPIAVALEADTTDGDAVDAALDRFAEATGSPAPDGLVCNAGIVRFGPLLEIDAADWRAVVDVNLTGTFTTARAAARRMVAAGRPGSIVAITSMNGVAPGPHAGAYGATKAGVARLTQQMALEWAPHGIRVNAVAPGLIDAGMSEPIYADADIRRRRSQAVPLGRLGTGEDVASVVLFLLSDAAGYVTATELLVDGGVTSSVIATLPRPRSVDSVGDRTGDATPPGAAPAEPADAASADRTGDGPQG